MSAILSPLIWKIGCVNAAVAVIMASAGGHKPWDENRKQVYSKGITHHYLASVGLILSSLKASNFCALLFFLGTLLFSFTIYYRCFKDDTKFNKLMPIGGTCFILGWLSLAFI